MSIFRRVREFYQDPEYLADVRRIAVPIIIQQLMFSGLNMLGVIFVGQKGDASVAAVGLAGQIAFLLNLVHFGIISGAAMFTAQFWGKRDIANLRRVLGLCLMLAIAASLIFFLLAQLFPSQILIQSPPGSRASCGTPCTSMRSQSRRRSADSSRKVRTPAK